MRLCGRMRAGGGGHPLSTACGRGRACVCVPAAPQLVCLENTHNRCGGRVLSLEYVRSVGALAKELGLKVGSVCGCGLLPPPTPLTTATMPPLCAHLHTAALPTFLYPANVRAGAADNPPSHIHPPTHRTPTTHSPHTHHTPTHPHTHTPTHPHTHTPTHPHTHTPTHPHTHTSTHPHTHHTHTTTHPHTHTRASCFAGVSCMGQREQLRVRRHLNFSRLCTRRPFLLARRGRFTWTVPDCSTP